jgi:hypothetical protein
MNKLIISVLIIGLFFCCVAHGEQGFVSIIKPKTGDSVFLRSMVEGKSSAVTDTGLRACVLVWPIEANGPWWVQPTKTKSDGNWESHAYFGREGSIDVGKTFKIIAILVTEELVDGSTLPELPSRLAESEEIIVTRK